MDIIHADCLTLFLQMKTITSTEELRGTYFTHLSSFVKNITSFARGIPNFSSLCIEDQHVLIKSGVLEVSFAQQYQTVDVTEDVWTQRRLGFAVNREIWEDESCGPLGGVFSACHSLALKLSKLQLTDVELSLFASLLLFCSGICWLTLFI